jgi:hypothetical protein
MHKVTKQGNNVSLDECTVRQMEMEVMLVPIDHGQNDLTAKQDVQPLSRLEMDCKS